MRFSIWNSVSLCLIHYSKGLEKKNQIKPTQYYDPP